MVGFSPPNQPHNADGMTPEKAKAFYRLFTEIKFMSSIGMPQSVRDRRFQGWTSHSSADVPWDRQNQLGLGLDVFSGREAWLKALGKFAHDPHRETPGGRWIIYVDVPGLKKLAEQAKDSPASQPEAKAPSAHLAAQQEKPEADAKRIHNPSFLMSMSRPLLGFAQLDKLLTGSICSLVADFPGHTTPDVEGKRMLRVDEEEIRKLVDEAEQAGHRIRIFGDDAHDKALGSLCCGWDQPGGEGTPKRYYIREETIERYLDSIDPEIIAQKEAERIAEYERNTAARKATQPLTHGEIYSLQKTRDPDLSGPARDGMKEFTYSTLTRLLGEHWQTRLSGYWEETTGTGTDNVASVRIEALMQKMQDDKTRHREENNMGLRRRRPYGGGSGFGGGGFWI